MLKMPMIFSYFCSGAWKELMRRFDEDDRAAQPITERVSACCDQVRSVQSLAVYKSLSALNCLQTRGQHGPDT